MKRSIKFLFGGLIFTATIAAIGLYWLLSTESALQWVSKKLEPQIQMSSITGTLTGFSFANLSIDLQTTEIHVATGKVEWILAGLFDREFRIDSIELTDADILTKPKPQEQSTGPQDINLPLALTIEQARFNDISLTLEDSSPITLDSLRLEGTSLRGNILDLESLDIHQAENYANISGQIDLSTREAGLINLEHSSSWLYKDQTIQSSGLISGTWRSISITLEGTNPVEFELDGQLNGLLSDSVSWNTNTVISAASSLNLAGQSILINSTEFQTIGQYAPMVGLESLTVDLEGLIRGSHEEFPTWEGRTKLQLKSLNLGIETLNLRSLASDQPLEFELTGTLQSPSLLEAQQAVFDSTIVDLSGSWDSLTWPLRSESPLVTSNGSFSVTGPLNNIHLLATSDGEADEQNVIADIDLLIGATSFVVNSFELSADSSNLQMSGIVDEQLQLTWAANSTDVSTLFTDMSGQISGTGTLSGERDNPKLFLTAQTTGLSNQQFSIGTAKIFASASPSDPSEELTVSIAADNLQFDQQLVAESLNLELDGSTQEHTLAFSSQLAKDSSAQFEATGQWLNSQWNADVSNISISNPLYGTWALDRELRLSATQNELDASNSCLTNSGQSICAEFHQSENNYQLSGNFSAISFDNLSPLLELYSMKVDGLANGEFSFAKNQNESSAIANIDLSAENSKIVWINSGQDEQADETFEFKSLHLAVAQDSKFHADAELRISDNDLISAQINIDSPLDADRFQSAELAADGNIHLENLTVLPIAMLDNIGLSGSFNSAFSVNGTINDPELFATGALRNSTAALPDLGLYLDNINLELTATGNSTIHAIGSFNSGSGLLNFDGDIDLAELTNPAANFSFRGDNIQLVDTHELKAVGEVDLSAKIARDKLDLSGLVSMDQARLNFVLPESLIQASSDVILEGETVQTSAFQQILDINLDFGEDTQIEAQGFQSNLTGGLRIFQEAGGILRGQGQLVLSDGYYQGYGQNLEIDDGQVIFTGGSIEEPNLDIQAQETIGDTIAGIRITGQADAPEIALFSTPSMSDEDILSMLMFRKPVSELSSQDGIVLLSIASSLQGNGTNQVTQLTDKVQQIFGLSTFELNLTDTDPNVFVGKQISSKLNVGYGYSLLDAVQSLILEYKVNQVWSVKANAGANSGADLLYKIER